MPPENQNDAYARKEKLDKRKKELEWLRSTNATRINRAKEEKLRIEYYIETRKSFEDEWKESELNIFLGDFYAADKKMHIAPETTAKLVVRAERFENC